MGLVTTPEDERNWLAMGDLKRFAEDARNDQSNGFEVKVSAKTSSSTRTSYEQSIGAGVQLSFAETVTVGVNGQWNKQEMKFKTSTEELQILLGAKGYKAIPVAPKKTWFEPEVFQKYRSSDTHKKIDFFGRKSDSGSLQSARIPHYPKTLFVAVKPFAEMFVAKDDAEELQKSKDFSVQAQIGFSVGSFDFNFSRKDSFESKKETSKLYKVTLTGNSPTPLLLAVDNHILAA